MHELKMLVEEIAAQNNIDAKLLDAIVLIESDYDPWAVRYEPKYRYIMGAKDWAHRNGVTTDTETLCQRMSWGLAQIMGGTSRSLGYTGPLTQLLDPRINLMYACRLLTQLRARYPHDVRDQIAAYNAGSARRHGDGKYVNQGYVDLVVSKIG